VSFAKTTLRRCSVAIAPVSRAGWRDGFDDIARQVGDLWRALDLKSPLQSPHSECGDG
jgi:hypothetical protein